MLITASAAGIVRSLSEATYSGLVEEELFGGLKDDSFWNLGATFSAVPGNTVHKHIDKDSVRLTL
jgi:hypothetical protein